MFTPNVEMSSLTTLFNSNILKSSSSSYWAWELRIFNFKQIYKTIYNLGKYHFMLKVIIYHCSDTVMYILIVLIVRKLYIILKLIITVIIYI